MIAFARTPLGVPTLTLPPFLSLPLVRHRSRRPHRTGEAGRRRSATKKTHMMIPMRISTQRLDGPLPRLASSLSPCAESSSSSSMSSTWESRHSLDSRPSTPSSSTRGGIVPAGVGQRCPLPSLLLRVPADARRSLLPMPRIDGDLVNAHRAALGRYRDRRGRRRLRLLPPLLRSFSSIVFAPPDSSSRSSSSAPDDGPFCTPSSRCRSRPPSEDERRPPATAQR
jgi:hypothetical protein